MTVPIDPVQNWNRSRVSLSFGIGYDYPFLYEQTCLSDV